MAKSFKKNKKGKVVGLIIGLLLGAALAAGIACYFTIPGFKEWVNNGGQEFANLFKKK